MDDVWERTVPLFLLKPTDVDHIFHEFDEDQTVVHYRAINNGCRNSNYCVTTAAGRYLLRITPENDDLYKNEIATTRALRGLIKLPELYADIRWNNRTVLIYEYLESVTLQSLVAKKEYPRARIITQVAQGASFIHSLPITNIPGLMKVDFPPFEQWYDLFLSNHRARERLGVHVTKRVQNLLKDEKECLSTIDRYRSFIHGDFRPANMLVTDEGTVFFVDWEFASSGHILADIGQFFRYDHCFEEKDFSLLYDTYNAHAQVSLPHDWRRLIKLRDLVNPLQMIGSKDALPQKYTDLRNVILTTLLFFGH